MTRTRDLLSVEATLFADWRSSARRLLAAEVEPNGIRWIDARARDRDGQGDLFDQTLGRDDHRDAPAPWIDRLPRDVEAIAKPRVPRQYLEMANTIASHSSPERWELLYRILWRINHGQRHLLSIASDSDVYRATALLKAVRRDAHKTKAFVRFRKTADTTGELYVAWHRPDHYALDQTADFFARRFDVMRWTILTPRQSAYWDGKSLSMGPGTTRADAPVDDELETLWKTYYANIFNPARIKIKAMQAEMPKKHWATMPETELIDQMLRDAPARAEAMIAHQEGGVTARPFLPAEDRPPLATLCRSAAECRGCELASEATQTVFGRGPADAKLMVIGEQPGDTEDRSGVPFTGPAGDLLRQTFAEVGIDASQVYLTNTVKHFKHTLRGKRRLHVKPSAREIAACRPWLDAELQTVAPEMILCLGATAATAILGPSLRITQHRGQVLTTQHAAWTLATYHPSALLRAKSPETKSTMLQTFQDDLHVVAERLRLITND